MHDFDDCGCPGFIVRGFFDSTEPVVLSVAAGWSGICFGLGCPSTIFYYMIAFLAYNYDLFSFLVNRETMLYKKNTAAAVAVKFYV